MLRFSFRSLISRSNYNKLKPRGGRPVTPRVGAPRTNPLYWFTDFGCPVFEYIFASSMFFVSGWMFFKWDPLYFTHRFRFGSPKFRVLDFNHMDFNLINLRNSIWVPLNFDFWIFFQKLSFQFIFTTLFQISDTSLFEKLPI